MYLLQCDACTTSFLDPAVLEASYETPTDSKLYHTYNAYRQGAYAGSKQSRVTYRNYKTPDQPQSPAWILVADERVTSNMSDEA